jgi:molybdate transport system substrate-binding protein
MSAKAIWGRARLLIVAILFLGSAGPARADDLLVFAAASLKNALDDADAAWTAERGITAKAVYLASGPLAKQIENGAPADIFISADLAWMDYLQSKRLIKPDTRADFLGNTLVLVAPAPNDRHVEIAPSFPLAKLLGDGRLAIGDPQSVPAGNYAKAALEQLGVWGSVEPKLARAENVRAVLALVSRREVPLGITYATDAAADSGVAVVGTFPPESHPPILYPIAITAASTNPQAPKFLAWLRSAAEARYFERYGFTVLK